MAQISKMSGTSWHVEEHYKTRVHTRNCVNCKYFQTEGRMCRKKNEHISFNFANHCKHFDNMYRHITATRKKTTTKNKVEKNIKKKEPVRFAFLIQTKQKWTKKSIRKKKSIVICCDSINDKNTLELMKKTSFIVCYDGSIARKIQVKFIDITENQLHFNIKDIYEFHIPGFIRLSNSKSQISVTDKNYNSVLFIQERLGR